MHGEVSPDSPLGDESRRHRAESLPYGEHPRSVDLFLCHAGRLLDELTEDLRLEVLHVETLLEDLLDLFDGVCQAVLTQETVEDLDCLRMSRSILSLFVSCTYIRTSVRCSNYYRLGFYVVQKQPKLLTFNEGKFDSQVYL